MWLIELAPVGDPAAVPDVVATTLGVTPQAAMSVTAAIAQALGARPGVDHEARVKSQSAMDHKPSILQDFELGRPMEIDGMFDAPLALARIAGVETPTLDLLVALCKLRGRASGLYGS